MRKLIFAISTLALATSASFADPPPEREAVMKANGAAMGALRAFAKGEQAYDAAHVPVHLMQISEDAQ